MTDWSDIGPKLLNQNAQILAALQGSVGKTPAAPNAKSWIDTVQFPLDFNNLVESLISAGITGIDAKYIRSQQSLAASGGSAVTAQLVVPVPDNYAAMLIQDRVLSSDLYTNTVTVTMQIDDQPNLLEAAPMSESITLSGALTGIVTNKTTYSLSSTSAEAVTFNEDTVAACITQEALRNTVLPILKLNGYVMNQLAGYAVGLGL